MFNFKISGIAAGAAFIVSVLLGFIGSASFAIILLRAFIFAIVFFALTVLAYWLLSQFVPELLSGGEDDGGFPVSGSRIDISLGDEAVTGAFPADSSEIVDDIAGRPSTLAKTASLPLDQERNAGYNNEGEVDGDLEFADDGQGLRTSTGMLGRGGDSLPDIDNLAEAAPESVAGVEAADDIGLDNSGHWKPKPSSRKSEMAGDFDPKELARAIQTVLKKDDKG